MAAAVVVTDCDFAASPLPQRVTVTDAAHDTSLNPTVAPIPTMGAPPVGSTLHAAARPAMLTVPSGAVPPTTNEGAVLPTTLTTVGAAAPSCSDAPPFTSVFPHTSIAPVKLIACGADSANVAAAEEVRRLPTIDSDAVLRTATPEDRRSGMAPEAVHVRVLFATNKSAPAPIGPSMETAVPLEVTDKPLTSTAQRERGSAPHDAETATATAPVTFAFRSHAAPPAAKLPASVTDAAVPPSTAKYDWRAEGSIMRYRYKAPPTVAPTTRADDPRAGPSRTFTAPEATQRSRSTKSLSDVAPLPDC